MKIALLGAHSKRIPLTYPVYRRLATDFDYVESPEEADWVVFGFSKDIKDGFEYLVNLLSKNTGIRLMVLSEEPLWDTLWSGDYLQRKSTVERASEKLCYTVLNHFTSELYNFSEFPYFITTCDEYFVRYGNFFRRNAKLSAEEIRNIWRNARIRQAYFAEMRAGRQYDVNSSKHDVIGLSGFRTRIAQLAKGDTVLRIGKGWGNKVLRQALPDWHLDKLATLDRQAYIVSGIENTHQPDYISEKVFDAFAVLGIPLYVASPKHSVHRLVPKGSFINLYGLTPDEAVEVVHTFEVDSAFVEVYREAQARLSILFTDPVNLWAERRRFIDRIMGEFRRSNRGL